MTDPSPAASKSLLLSRRFAPLFWCQFFSAFSDNFLKNALVFLILFKIGGVGRRVADHAGGGGVHRAVSSSCRRSAARSPTATTRRWWRSG